MNEVIPTSTRPVKDDMVLIQAFQAGDKSAFDELVFNHKDRLFNVCYWFLGDYHEANDSAQETFIKAYRSLKTFRFQSSFSTWLHRIAVNTCKNKIKSLEYRYQKKMVRMDNPGDSEDGIPSMEIGDESQSPLKELEKKERLMLIKQAIDSLHPEQKTVVVLRDIQGLSYEEIAQVTGLNLGTVKSKLARARLELRDKLRSVI
jgi:RNA polymerase sigma-70 factor (ECF subfamily)